MNEHALGHFLLLIDTEPGEALPRTWVSNGPDIVQHA